MTSIKLYHIKHPLSNKDLPDQTLATFTDQDVADYSSEFKVYQQTQNDCVRDLSTIIDDCRDNLKVIFGNSSEGKQLKYFDRMVRSGETVTDTHSNMFPRPEEVRTRVLDARKKYSSFMGKDNAPKANGDDSLKEINNAVAFLMEKGMTLNSDFTVSNAVSVAKSLYWQGFNDNLIESKDVEGWSSLTNNIIMACDGGVFPTNSFAYSGAGVNELKFRLVDINLDLDSLSSSVKAIIDNNGTFNYTISFLESQTPTLVIS